MAGDIVFEFIAITAGWVAWLVLGVAILYYVNERILDWLEECPKRLALVRLAVLTLWPLLVGAHYIIRFRRQFN